ELARNEQCLCRPIWGRIRGQLRRSEMNDRARRFCGSPPIHQPPYGGQTLTSNSVGGEEDTGCADNGGSPDRSGFEWATEILAGVVRKAAENPEAPFTIAALQAAAIVEEQDFTTFLRYRRNLKERHVAVTELDEGLRRFKTQRRAAARAPMVASAAGALPSQGPE